MEEKVRVDKIPIGCQFKVYSQCPPSEFAVLERNFKGTDFVLCRNLNNVGRYYVGELVKFDPSLIVSIYENKIELETI